jgi:CTP:molybdopterin cytidylyltransferase MocA
VVLPVDHVLVTGADVSALIRGWRTSGAPVVRPIFEGRGGHPILLAARVLPEVHALGDDDPLVNVVRAHRDRELRIPGSRATRVDVNTPADLGLV